MARFLNPALPHRQEMAHFFPMRQSARGFFAVNGYNAGARENFEGRVQCLLVSPFCLVLLASSPCRPAPRTRTGPQRSILSRFSTRLEHRGRANAHRDMIAPRWLITLRTMCRSRRQFLAARKDMLIRKSVMFACQFRSVRMTTGTRPSVTSLESTTELVCSFGAETSGEIRVPPALWGASQC